MKVILFNTPKGQCYLPLIEVAIDRANYYAEEYGFAKESDEYKSEIDLVMNDDYEGIDWLINNTDFEDWQNKVVKLNDDILIDEDDFWTCTGDFEITNIEN